MTARVGGTTARVGWTNVRVDTGAGEQQWLRLTAFQDGWVERPTFGRATSALGDTVRKVLVTLLLVVMAAGVAWGVIALAAAAGGTVATVLKLVGGVPLVLIAGWLMVRSHRRTRRRRKQWTGDLADLRRVRSVGIVPRRVPGTPWWRPVASAAECATRTSNVVLVPAHDVAAVRPGTTTDGDVAVEVLLRSGASRIYRSGDDAAMTLLGRYGAGRPVIPAAHPADPADPAADAARPDPG